MRFVQVRQFRLTAASFAVVLLGLVAMVNADSPKNKAVEHWKKFKPGSSVTLVSSPSGTGGFNVQVEMKNTLVDASDEKVTLQSESTTTFNGQRHPSPPRTQVIEAKGSQGDWKEVGHEKLEINGKKYDCTVVEGKSVTPARGGAASDARAKMWVTDDVPGGIVQIEVNGAGHAMTFTMSSFEIK